MELPLVGPRDPNYEAEEVRPGVGGNKTIKLNTLVPDIRVSKPYNNPFWKKSKWSREKKEICQELRELGYYIDLGGTAFEVPRIDVEQNRLLELVNRSVDVIYPSGQSGANRLVVDVMMYKERRGGS
jgi:hypothetical protein